MVAYVQQSDSFLPTNPVLASSTGQHTLTLEQYEQLMTLLSKQNMVVTPQTEEHHSAYLSGKSFYLFTAKLGLSWIIDSGATDRITPHLHLFQSFVPVSRPCFIILPNGKNIQVQNIVTIALNANIILHDVLHVPEFHSICSQLAN